MSFPIEWWWAPLLNQCSWLWREGGERLRPMVEIDQTCLGGNLAASKPLNRSKLLPQFEGLCLASPSSTWGRTCSSPSTSLYTSFSPSSSSFFSSSRGRRTEGSKDANCRHLESPFQGQVLPVRQWGEQDGPCLFHLIKAEKHHGKHHSERIVGAWNASYSYKWMQITFQLAWSDAIGADVDGEGQMNAFKRGFRLIDSSQKP